RGLRRGRLDVRSRAACGTRDRAGRVTERVQHDPVRNDLRQRELGDQTVRAGFLDDLEAVLPIVAKGLLKREPREGSELPGVLLDLLAPLDLFPPRHLAEVVGVPGGNVDLGVVMPVEVLLPPGGVEREVAGL